MTALGDLWKFYMDQAREQYVHDRARWMFCQHFGEEPTEEQVEKVRRYVNLKLDRGEDPFPDEI